MGVNPYGKPRQLRPIQVIRGMETHTPIDIHAQPKIVQIQRGLRA